MALRASSPIPIESVEASAYSIPTDAPESDGTLEWDSTTLVLASVRAGGQVGVGYTYAGAPVVTVVHSKLADALTGADALQPPARWAQMQHAVRNLGKPGVVAEAISAVDIALWDLRARLLDEPLVIALGAVHDATPIYGSGGFTSYDNDTLRAQLCGWVEAGIARVKMKVGRDPDADIGRVAAARSAIGDDAELFVDANGAYQRKQALLWAERFAEYDVRWFEEPVSSDDLDGLHQLCEQGPAGMDIAAGEYGYHLPYFHRMLAARAVDCCRPTLPGPSASPESSRLPHCVTRAAWTSRCTVPRRSVARSAPPSGTCATWSISTTMCGSKGWRSTGPSIPSPAACCARTGRRPDTD